MNAKSRALDRTLRAPARRARHEAGALNKRNLGLRQCSPSCTQIAPQRAANEEKSYANHHEQYSRYQQRRAAQDKCGTEEPQRVALPAAHQPERQPNAAAYQAVSYTHLDVYKRQLPLCGCAPFPEALLCDL